MPEKVNRVRAILAQNGINIKNLCSTDSDLQALVGCLLSDIRWYVCAFTDNALSCP